MCLIQAAVIGERAEQWIKPGYVMRGSTGNGGARCVLAEAGRGWDCWRRGRARISWRSPARTSVSSDARGAG